MSKRTKTILLVLLAGFVLFCTYSFFGLYSLAVEDRYGDLQDIYWRAKDGDVMVNRQNGQFAYINIDRPEFYVYRSDLPQTAPDNWLDLYKRSGFDVALYRWKNAPDDVEKLTMVDLRKAIQSGTLKLVKEQKADYK